ncbi:MAG: TRAP transporter small permease subunit [Gammaproteobacteria bacterium]|nr:TRAP transporter small permease subunit [Gammaproteobacteria bacterium]
MNRLIVFLERIVGTSGVVAAWLVVPLIIASCYEVFSRYVLNAPTIWAFELAYMAMGAHFLIGAAYTLREKGHIRIDVLYSHFSPRAQAWVDVFGFTCFMLPASWWISWGLWEYALDAYLSGELSGQSAWNPAIWPFRMVFFSGFLLLSIQGTLSLLKAISIAFARGDRVPDDGSPQ